MESSEIFTVSTDSVSSETSKFGNFKIPVDKVVGTVTKLSVLGCIQNHDKTKLSCFGLKRGSEVWKVLNVAHMQKLLLTWFMCVRSFSLTGTGLQKVFWDFWLVLLDILA